ncbi:hypothetical protein I9G50_004568 [Salmonella enterica]|nr:hypothetical protein [Salmonella enterica]EHK3918221.1 hypothetical protein [Salmonella enterica subsp. enterica serovar Poona]EHN6577850.1 hypothetical protein [Salmonella enterica subsp. enterica serovar Anecho]EGS6736307.1 hypothetical protein [Salmonella enterica]EHJ6152731.1 hypothetical protein [Salmonella enterica]
MHKHDNVSVLRAADCTSRVSIVLAGAGFRTYQKRNQTLKNGTPHENNPVAGKNAG